MIAQKLEELIGTSAEVEEGNRAARRFSAEAGRHGLFHARHAVGEGIGTFISHANYLEAVCCIEGGGEIELADTGEEIQLTPDALNARNGSEKHRFRTCHDDARSVRVQSAADGHRGPRRGRGDLYRLFSCREDNEEPRAAS